MFAPSFTVFVMHFLIPSGVVADTEPVPAVASRPVVDLEEASLEEEEEEEEEMAAEVEDHWQKVVMLLKKCGTVLMSMTFLLGWKDSSAW
jgi:hypothetical protein